MNVREYCRKVYRETVESEQNIPSELKRALKTHERVPTFIDNLAGQLSRIKNVPREKVEHAVRDMTRWFIRAVDQQSKERLFSDLARLTIKHEAQIKQDLDKAVDALDQSGVESESQEKTKAGETVSVSRTTNRIPAGVL